MATYDNTYSRVIAWLKILLPLVALGLLSTMFMISRSINPEGAIPYASVDVEGIARDQRITGPSFSGVTPDGAAVRFSADSALPVDGASDIFNAANLAAQIDLPSGAGLTFSAPNALIDGAASRVSLDGGVSIDTTTRYHIDAPSLTATTDLSEFIANGGISATGPMGTLTAGEARLDRGETEDAPFHLVFTNGVELVYDPAEQGSE